MSRRSDFYLVKKNDNLAAPDFWNRRFLDIDTRIALREQDADNINNALDALEALGLARLNDTFTPMILEAQQRLNTLGASFSAESLDTKTIASSGAMTFILTEATAENYVYTDYVSIRAASSPTNKMLALVNAFDRASRSLDVTVVSSEGSGTFSDWQFRVGTPPDLTHAGRTDNPHNTTAAQVGSYTISAADAAIAAAIAAIPGVDLSSRLAIANNLSDLGNIVTARQNLGLGSLATSSSVGWGEIASNIWSTAANFRAKAANKSLTAEAVWDSAAYVPLTDAATIALDLDTGFNFYVTLSTSRTLGFPTHGKVGQSGYIDVTQPSGGNAALGFASGYTFDIGVPPSLDLNANRVSSLYYHYRSSGEVRIGTAFKGVRAS